MPCGGGFTLLELLIVLVIVSILVVAGSSGLLMDEDHMDSGVKLLVDVIHESRGVAISGNRPIEIHASAEKIQILHNDKPLRVEMFPPGVVLYAVNDKVLNNDYFSIFFNRFGISRDYVLILQEGEDFMTIYMPAVGSPHILKNLISLDDARKECL
jgi:prepilin-type N-terminal cleavage/methylation domain-containing protein